MNVLKPMPGHDEPRADAAVPTDRETALPTDPKPSKRGSGGRWLALLVFLLLAGGLAAGTMRHSRLADEVASTAAQRLEVVPAVRVATVKSSGDTISVTLPGTTEAFEAASIYSRTSGYIAKR
ncbi:MAG: efflux RND transporter periplasmic adaptor subunit, partial [Bradyrhizobiaceae bacterium]|nr:efflux RND transporter periplasmic adaptor subunit [Bradyrhizobiaceae bacterium]